MFYANKKNNKFSKLKIDWYVILQEKCYVLKLYFQTNPPHWIAARSAVGQEPALGQKKENRKAAQTRNPQCSNPAHAREK